MFKLLYHFKNFRYFFYFIFFCYKYFIFIIIILYSTDFHSKCRILILGFHILFHNFILFILYIVILNAFIQINIQLFGFLFIKAFQITPFLIFYLISLIFQNFFTYISKNGLFEQSIKKYLLIFS